MMTPTRGSISGHVSVNRHARQGMVLASNGDFHYRISGREGLPEDVTRPAGVLADYSTDLSEHDGGFCVNSTL